ncbi:MAG TPA: hypothetical protein VGD37_42095 [Kofleriaceae bacterium]
MTAAGLKPAASWLGEYGKSKLSLALAVGWVSLVPQMLSRFRSVQATALLPVVLRVELTQPLGDAVALPLNDTTTRRSVVSLTRGGVAALNTR